MFCNEAHYLNFVHDMAQHLEVPPATVFNLLKRLVEEQKIVEAKQLLLKFQEKQNNSH